MLQDLLIPEDFLQLDQLKFAIELSSETSFFSIIGIDTEELNKEIGFYFQEEFIDLENFIPKTDNIFQEIINSDIKNKFLYINYYEKNNEEFINNLLFYRDFIADYDLKVVIIVNTVHYKYIIKNAIDLYNIASFNYMLNTFKIDIFGEIDKKDLYDLLKEYKQKRKSITKKQRVAYLYNIGLLYSKYGETSFAFKYYNESISLAKRLNNQEMVIAIKFQLSSLYRRIAKYTIAEKYLLECKKYYELKLKTIELKNVLLKLTELYMDQKNIELSEKYCNEFYNLAESTHDKSMMLDALDKFLNINIKKENKNKIEYYFEKTKKLAEELNDKFILNQLNQLKAIEYLNNNKSHQAIKYLNLCVTYFKENKNIVLLNEMYAKVGYAYYQLDDYKKALVYSEFCYKYFKKNNVLDSLHQTAQYLSFIYYEKNDMKKSMGYITEAIQIAKKLNLTKELYFNYKYLSQIYGSLEKYEESLKYINIASKYIGKKDKYDLYSRYADIYKDLNDINNAYKYFKLIEKESEYFKNNEEYLDELYGEILLKDKQFENALNYFKSSLKLAVKKDSKFRVNSVEINIAYTYLALKNYTMAKKFFTETLNRLEITNKEDRRIPQIKKELENL